MHPVINFLDKIYKSLNKNNCDFNILLKKLSPYGFRGTSNTWFEKDLRNRF